MYNIYIFADFDKTLNLNIHIYICTYMYSIYVYADFDKP